MKFRFWVAGGICVLAFLLVVMYASASRVMSLYLGMPKPGYGVRVERGVTIPVSGGLRLSADIFHPRNAGSVPTILVRIPLTPTTKNVLFKELIGRLWASHGYVVVFQGTRGRLGSEGAYDPLVHERQDGIDTLEWLKGQPWFDGRLGMWGGSYFGYTQWAIADRISAPAAFFIQIASTSFHDMFYPGGVFSLQSALYWAMLSHGSADVIPDPEALERGYESPLAIEADDRAGLDIPFYDDWVTHTERDAYWQEIDGVDRTKTINGPVFLMAGWFDPFLPTELRDFGRLKSGSKLVIGPWAHARTVDLPGGPKLLNYRIESIKPTIAWFDHVLKDKESTPAQVSPVRIFVMGRNVWRDEGEWPLARVAYTPYYLGDDQSLSTKSDRGGTVREFEYQPNDPVPSAGGAVIGPGGGTVPQNEIEERPDVLVYSTPVLTEDIEVTGPVRLHLSVSTSAASADFTAKLVDVHPDGTAYNISNGILRRDYTPGGAPERIQIDLWPTSNVFLKGHRIRLEVSSSNYPVFDRNPNEARQSIYSGPDSYLLLPVIPTD